MFPRKMFEKEIKARELAHRGQASGRFLVGDESLGKNEFRTHAIGIVAEAQFEKDFGLPRDKRILPKGDGGVDFTLGQYTFDVKALGAKAMAARVIYIFAEVDKQYAQIIVQGEFNQDENNVWVRWLAWEYSEKILECPVQKFHPKGPQNHYKPVHETHKMAELELLIKNEKIRLGLIKPEIKNQIKIELALGAFCGSYACGGCYEVSGKMFHRPRPGYDQKDLLELDRLHE